MCLMGHARGPGQVTVSSTALTIRRGQLVGKQLTLGGAHPIGRWLEEGLDGILPYERRGQVSILGALRGIVGAVGKVSAVKASAQPCVAVWAVTDVRPSLLRTRTALCTRVLQLHCSNC
jgi:hypothetical protein